MHVQVEADTTGMAPRDCRFSAVDTDTYDGAEDSPNRNRAIGWGETPAEAIADLLRLLDEETNGASDE